MKVGIAHQGFIPHYRVRFFERLAAEGANDYVVFHGQPPSGLGHYAATSPFGFPDVPVRNRELRVAGKSLIYQPVLREAFRRGLDGMVLGTHAQFVSNHLLLVAFKARGRKVVYWGHGTEQVTGTAVGRSLARAGTVLKSGTLRLADGFIAYTPGGRDRLIADGYPAERVRAVGNTLDLEEQVRLHERFREIDDAAMRAQLGLRAGSVVLVYVGRIYPEKRVDDLVLAAQRIQARRPDLALDVVVIGDGPDGPRVRAAAEGVPFVRFLGEVRDQAEVARFLRVAAAVVAPGKLGLTVNHALAHGVPIVTRPSPHHAPELEYLTPGQDSLMVDGDLDAFAAAIERLVCTPELRDRLAAGALAARDRLDLGAMVRAFDDAVTALLRGAS